MQRDSLMCKEEVCLCLAGSLAPGRGPIGSKQAGQLWRQMRRQAFGSSSFAAAASTAAMKMPARMHALHPKGAMVLLLASLAPALISPALPSPCFVNCSRPVSVWLPPSHQAFNKVKQDLCNAPAQSAHRQDSVVPQFSFGCACSVCAALGHSKLQCNA